MELADLQKAVSISSDPKQIAECNARIKEIECMRLKVVALTAADAKAIADSVAAAIDSKSQKRKFEAESESAAPKKSKPDPKSDDAAGGGGGGAAVMQRVRLHEPTTTTGP